VACPQREARQECTRGASGRPSSAQEQAIARSLQMVWFASLVGWSGGLHTQAGIVDQTRAAAELMLLDRGA